MVKSAAPVNQLFCSLDIFNRGRQLNHALSIALHTILADTDTDTEPKTCFPIFVIYYSRRLTCRVVRITFFLIL